MKKLLPIHLSIPNYDKETVASMSILAAVLEVAVHDARRNVPDAILFFQSKRSPFWEICDHLGIDPQLVISGTFNK